MTEQQRRIFLCYAKEDYDSVKKLYDQLKAAGYDPWLDKEDLVAGRDWWAQIKKIITDPYNLVVVCLTCNSITKRGVVQREIKRALDVLEMVPDESIYLIPARLEDCQVPDRLSDLHWVNLFEPNGFERLKDSLNLELSKHPLPGSDWKSSLRLPLTLSIAVAVVVAIAGIILFLQNREIFMFSASGEIPVTPTPPSALEGAAVISLTATSTSSLATDTPSPTFTLAPTYTRTPPPDAPAPAPTDTPIPPTDTPIPTPVTGEPTPTKTPVPPTATASNTPIPPPPPPTPTRPVSVTIYLYDALDNESPLPLSGEGPHRDVRFIEGTSLYGEAAAQIGDTVHAYNRDDTSQNVPLPDGWRWELEYAQDLADHTNMQPGINQPGDFWLGKLDYSSAVGSDNPYTMTVKLYQGDQERGKVQVFFTVDDAPGVTEEDKTPPSPK